MATAERLTFVLSCTECKNKNYYFAKGKKKDYKVELNKFCKKCGKQTFKTGTEGSSPSAPARF